MGEFETELRDRIAAAERTLTEAMLAGHDYEVHLHGARIRDLLELAERHGIDTDDWVDSRRLDSAVLGG